MQDSREHVLVHDIEDEMKVSYLDYAMSVIVGRALPDVRDGLKPVHRRVIYAMYDLGFTSSHKYEKSAKSVGHVMGNFHPHGDQAIYETLVRMAQDFSMRYPLIDGQGNFGSIDGDPPAAMRYTEARLSRYAELLLQDIDKNTVDWTPNYDASLMEPTVLPSAFPNLLCNGSSGIAVGMSTNIPPHNLSEVVDACVALIDNPRATIAELMKYLPGPDFPTGGSIYGRKGIIDAYTTGRGKVIMRARMKVEQLKGGRQAIVVTEIPYAVNKAKIVESIASLVQSKKLTGISDLRDESDRNGLRIVIELKRDEIPEIVINNLYKHTQLQETFPVIMLALVDNKPRYLSLPRLIQLYLNHRRDVVIRRTRFELDRAEKRLHIVHGLCVVQDNIDKVVHIIRNAASAEEAKEKLMAALWIPLELVKIIKPEATEPERLSAEQAQAILDMRLSRLTQLEKSKLLEERDQLAAAIVNYRRILNDIREVWSIVRNELLEIKKKYGDSRRTEIVEETAEIRLEDLVADENMVITISHSQYIKRTPTDQYRRQRRGGKGVLGADTKDEDWIEHLFVGTTHNCLLFFTDKGRAYWLMVYDIPQAGRQSRGRAVANLLQLAPDEKICAVLPVRSFEEGGFLIFATAKGQICKQPLSLYSKPRRTGVKAINIVDGDTLVDVKLTTGQQEIILATRRGMAIRFHESAVRPMGRDTTGVRGIKLGKGDEVIGLEAPRPNATLLTVCEKGYGKRSAIADYRITNRGGKGVINIKTTERNGLVVAVKEVIDGEELIVMTREGIAIRLRVSDIRVISRNTQGVKIINLQEGDVVTGVARLAEPDDDEASEDAQETSQNSAEATPSSDTDA
jgi:DNA gyrase subunit A